MLKILGSARRVCNGITRRDLLQVGGAGLFGLTLSRLSAAEAKPLARAGRAKSVLFVYLFGGPSQLETFDLKPDAPSGIRGPFKPVPSRTPELKICEHLPRLAAKSDRFCVVRTVTHQQNDHNACHYIQTGHPMPQAPRGAAGVAATDKDWPAIGSIVEYLNRQRGLRAFPSYVYLPNRLGHIQGYDRSGQYGGWLGRTYNALATQVPKRDAKDNPYFRPCEDDELEFRIAGLASDPALTLDRLDGRRSLLAQFEMKRRTFITAAEADHGSYRQQAFDFVTSEELRRALDIRRESPQLRDRYGRHLFGQSMLMGRRMIEAGARFVTVLWDAPDGYSWDSHRHSRDVERFLLPGLDQSLSALLDDLKDRGLLDQTLVVCLGEMGRTPKPDTAQWGRGHWSYCFPALLAGAGVGGGRVYGKSDRDAAYPVDCPVKPEDLAATVYHALGIEPDLRVPNAENRPTPLVEGGEPLRALWS